MVKIKNHSLLRLMNAFFFLWRVSKRGTLFPGDGTLVLALWPRLCSSQKNTAKILSRGHRKLVRRVDFEFICKKQISGKPREFLVYLTETEDIINFGSWWVFQKTVLSETAHSKNVPKEKKLRLQISKFIQYSHYAIVPFGVKVITYIDGLQVQTLNLKSSTSDPLAMPQEMVYPNGFLPKNIKKITDLKSSNSTYGKKKITRRGKCKQCLRQNLFLGDRWLSGNWQK